MRITKAVERWFKVPNDPDNGELLIKNLTPGEISKIFDKVFKQEIFYKKGKSGKYEPTVNQKTDKALDREMTLTHVVVGWKNFYDLDGKEMTCTPESVITASKEITGFNELVAEFRDALALEIQKEKEEQEKN